MLLGRVEGASTKRCCKALREQDQVISTILLVHPFDNLHADGVLQFSSASLLNIPRKFQRRVLSHSCNSSKNSSSSSTSCTSCRTSSGIQ